MRRNAHKKETFEDKFARHYYCEHARLNSIRSDKKEQHKKFRRDFKKSLDKLLSEQYNIDIERKQNNVRPLQFYTWNIRRNVDYISRCYSSRMVAEKMRIYAIQRKADKKIVFSSASRRVIFDRFNKYHDRENYRIVILERG